MLLSSLRIVKWVRRVKCRVQGIENLETFDSPFIFASNHQSHVDTHVILDSLPKDIRKQTAVAAAFDHFADADGTSIKKRLIQFLVAAIWHAFGIERQNSPISSIRTMQNLLHRGWSIVIYPEGTRSRTGEIAKFKSGLAIVAKKSNRPVVPIYIQGGIDVLPEATYIPHSGIIHISFGEPLHFKQDESSAEFMARIETAVRSMATNQ
jgi:1-acyl-sn-glycerol-3-phosphate acyltransferase